MANSVGGTIEAVDYNSIRNKVIAVLGDGSGPTGYGQTARLQSTPVAPNQNVTATQWGNLRFDIFNCLVHQNGATPSVLQVSTGDPVRFGAGHPNNAYDTLANTITANKFNLGAGQFVVESLGSTTTGDITWASQFYVDITYTFSSADIARYFFNSGGQLRITSSFVPNQVKSQNTSWASLLTAAGTQSLGAVEDLFGPGITNAEYDISEFNVAEFSFVPPFNKNFYNLTSGYQTYHTSTASGPYSSNTYILQARSNVANNSLGTANQVFIRVLLTDPYISLGPPSPEDSVTGSLTITTNMIRASGVLQPVPTAGNFITSGPSTTAFSAFVFS